MELGKKVITAGAGLFLLGGFSVYLLSADDGSTQNNPTQLQSTDLAQSSSAINTEPKEEMTHDAFLAAAEVRREQQQEDKAEIERVEKLRKAKLNSVECKFWKQQQKTTSAAAKIEEKINYHCTLPGSSSSSAQPTAESGQSTDGNN